MTLLDIPSWAASLRKLVKIYQLAGGRPGLERVRYSFEITHVHESILILILYLKGVQMAFYTPLYTYT
jgi:hypothetical protein